jgi:hypothetical protein
MTARQVLDRLRLFLFSLSAVLFGGTIAELIAAKHWQEPLQLVPFALCALGLVALGLAWRWPSGRTLWGARVLMVVIAAGSLLGVYEHVEGDLEFARELRPDAAGWTLWRSALTGRDPLLASGVLAVAAALTIAATYATTALAQEERPAVRAPMRGGWSAQRE